MKIELRKVKYSKALSQETAAFTAEIFVDGKKRGDVRNDGGGGANLISPRALEVEIEAHAKTLPAHQAFGMTLQPNADSLVSTLLEAHLAMKDMLRTMKTKTLFVAMDGKLYAVKGSVAPKDATQVLNQLPPGEALAVYLKAAS